MRRAPAGSTVMPSRLRPVSARIWVSPTAPSSLGSAAASGRPALSRKTIASIVSGSRPDDRAIALDDRPVAVDAARRREDAARALRVEGMGEPARRGRGVGGRAVLRPGERIDDLRARARRLAAGGHEACRRRVVVAQHAGERECDDDGGQCDEDDGQQAAPGDRHETPGCHMGSPLGSPGSFPRGDSQWCERVRRRHHRRHGNAAPQRQRPGPHRAGRCNPTTAAPAPAQTPHAVAHRPHPGRRRRRPRRAPGHRPAARALRHRPARRRHRRRRPAALHRRLAARPGRAARPRGRAVPRRAPAAATVGGVVALIAPRLHHRPERHRRRLARRAVRHPRPHRASASGGS